jgi:hypothetical protein
MEVVKKHLLEQLCFRYRVAWMCPYQQNASARHWWLTAIILAIQELSYSGLFAASPGK